MTSHLNVTNGGSRYKNKRFIFLIAGMLLFAVIYFSPPWPDAVDPVGKIFTLSREGKGALAVALLAATWWVFEVVPIGITSLAIGVLQVHFLIRPAKKAFTDFTITSVVSPDTVRFPNIIAKCHLTIGTSSRTASSIS